MRTSTRQAQWVLRAQSDDREALELLLGSIQAPLRTYLSGVVGQTDADDVLQQVLISIYRKLVWLENPELFRPWAYRIASRAAYRWLKRRHRWHQADEPALDSNSMPEAPSESLLQQLPHIEGISPASRAVLSSTSRRTCRWRTSRRS